MRQIWFVRHGESEANAGLPSSDPDTIPLTLKGEQQADVVGKMWTEQPSRIISSPFSRALSTAQPTANRFPSLDVQEWDVHEFTYLSPARCTNTTTQQRRPWVEEYWARNDPDYIDGEGAESFSQLLARVSQTFSALKELPINESCAIFTHGMFMSATMLSVVTGFSPPSAQSMILFRQLLQTTPVPNGAVLKCMMNQQGEVFAAPLQTKHLSK